MNYFFRLCPQHSNAVVYGDAHLSYYLLRRCGVSMVDRNVLTTGEISAVAQLHGTKHKETLSETKGAQKEAGSNANRECPVQETQEVAWP